MLRLIHFSPHHRTYLMKPLIIILMIYVFIAQQLYKAGSVQSLPVSSISSVSRSLSLPLSLSLFLCLALPLSLFRSLFLGCVRLLIHTCPGTQTIIVTGRFCFCEASL